MSAETHGILKQFLSEVPPEVAGCVSLAVGDEEPKDTDLLAQIWKHHDYEGWEKAEDAPAYVAYQLRSDQDIRNAARAGIQVPTGGGEVTVPGGQTTDTPHEFYEGVLSQASKKRRKTQCQLVDLSVVHTMSETVMILPKPDALAMPFGVHRTAVRRNEVPCNYDGVAYAQRCWELWFNDALVPLARVSNPRSAGRITRWMERGMQKHDKFVLYEAFHRSSRLPLECTLSTEQIRALCSYQHEHPSNYTKEVEQRLLRGYRDSEYSEAVGRLRVVDASDTSRRIPPPSRRAFQPRRMAVVGDSGALVYGGAGRRTIEPELIKAGYKPGDNALECRIGAGDTAREFIQFLGPYVRKHKAQELRARGLDPASESSGLAMREPLLAEHCCVAFWSYNDLCGAAGDGTPMDLGEAGYADRSAEVLPDQGRGGHMVWDTMALLPSMVFVRGIRRSNDQRE